MNKELELLTINYFEILCVKYSRILQWYNTSEIDTLFNIVWLNWNNKYSSQYFNKYSSTIARDEIPHFSESETKAKVICLLDELRLVYSKLENLGVSYNDVRELLWELKPISRINLKQKKIIVFTDFNQIIHLTPMQWTIYKLFINHPEGIILKELSNYRKELLNIYMETTEKHNMTRINTSIDKILDPSQHAINEYISKIRKVITSILGPEVSAYYYYIKGERGRRYKIEVSRNLVSI